MLSEAYEEEAMKTLSVLEWHKWVKECREIVEDDEENAQHFLRYQGYCSLRIHSIRPNSQPSLLCENIEAVLEAMYRKRPERWPIDCILHYENAPAHNAQAVPGPEIDY
jgi:hypothetical protein